MNLASLQFAVAAKNLFAIGVPPSTVSLRDDLRNLEPLEDSKPRLLLITIIGEPYLPSSS
jgi:hypothetical protein